MLHAAELWVYKEWSWVSGTGMPCTLLDSFSREADISLVTIGLCAEEKGQDSNMVHRYFCSLRNPKQMLLPFYIPYILLSMKGDVVVVHFYSSKMGFTSTSFDALVLAFTVQRSSGKVPHAGHAPASSAVQLPGM